MAQQEFQVVVLKGQASFGLQGVPWGTQAVKPLRWQLDAGFGGGDEKGKTLGLHRDPKVRL
jgi:hypothetical protein